jgi:hypothetical protein
MAPYELAPPTPPHKPLAPLEPPPPPTVTVVAGAVTPNAIAPPIPPKDCDPPPAEYPPEPPPTHIAKTRVGLPTRVTEPDEVKVCLKEIGPAIGETRPPEGGKGNTSVAIKPPSSKCKCLRYHRHTISKNKMYN